MKSEFEILINFRTPEGFRACGQFFLGGDRSFAEDVFKGLNGSDDVADKAVIHLDLVEMTHHITERVKTMGCKLSELCGNCGHITRELFRLHAIEPK